METFHFTSFQLIFTVLGKFIFRLGHICSWVGNKQATLNLQRRSIRRYFCDSRQKTQQHFRQQRVGFCVHGHIFPEGQEQHLQNQYIANAICAVYFCQNGSLSEIKTQNAILSSYVPFFGTCTVSTCTVSVYFA